MEAAHWIWLAAGATGGVLVGAAACHWHLSRAIAVLNERLSRSEQARNGAVERSAQARAQIAQLNRAITELRKAHSMQTAPERRAETRQEREARAEAALTQASVEDKTLVQPRHGTLQAFADTQTFER